MRHFAVVGEVVALVLLAASALPLRRALAEVREAKGGGPIVGFGASLFAACCLAFAALVMGALAVMFPGQACRQGPPALAEPPFCDVVTVVALALVGALLALALSFVAWWPWRPPRRAQAIRALHVLALLAIGLAAHLFGYD